MPPTPNPAFTLLTLVGRPPDPAWAAALAQVAGALPEAECLVLGHGPPETVAPPLRALSGLPKGARIEIRTRPLTSTAALVAAATVARTPWVLWLPMAASLPDAGCLRRLLRRAAGAEFIQEAGGVRLFRRDALLRLPRIPGMHRCLPELFARHAPRPPGSRAEWLCRAYVALACTMVPGGAPVGRRA